jgi:hypothetical protein
MNASSASIKNYVAPRNIEQMGLIPRAIEEIFELVHNRAITDFQVHCSFVQIYNENLYDMLRSVKATPYCTSLFGSLCSDWCLGNALLMADV